MKCAVTFDESAWTIIEPLLPDDIYVRGVVLEDFMWFMGRSKNYKSNKEKIDDYIHHLRLKANPIFERRRASSQIFKIINHETIEKLLIASLIICNQNP